MSLIFQQAEYKKYTSDYVGCVERNYWGTSFQVYDSGYPESIIAKFPRYFGLTRKLIV
jgi:hypothetical protein